jgi:CO dehydrogenase maturation factor
MGKAVNRGLKLAVAGKGGVGKSTIAAALALLLARRGRRVLAVDADPDANLASALGVPAEKQRDIVPLSRHRALIEDRTGARGGQYGQIFKMNPEVSDIASDYAHLHDGVAILVLGAIETGGSGCACPEGVLIRALVTDLVLYRDEALVMGRWSWIARRASNTWGAPRPAVSMRCWWWWSPGEDRWTAQRGSSRWPRRSAWRTCG